MSSKQGRQLKLWKTHAPFQAQLVEMLSIVSASSYAHWHLSFASITDTKQPTAFQKLEMRPDTLGKKFKEIVSERLQYIVDCVDDDSKQVLEYNGASSQDENEIEHISLSQHSRLLDALGPLNKPYEMRAFENDTALKESLKFYVVSLWPVGTRAIHCFRMYSDSFELGHRWFPIFRDEQYFDTYDRPGFLFDHGIDCICWGDDLFILKKDAFHRIFRFYEYVSRDAEVAVSAINDLVGLGNLNMLTDACNRDHVFASKIAGLNNQSHLRKLNIKHFQRMIDRHGLHIRVGDEGGRQVILYNSKYRWEFYHLLADNYLHSKMTLRDYRSTAKRPVSVTSAKQRKSNSTTHKAPIIPDVSDTAQSARSSERRRTRV